MNLLCPNCQQMLTVSDEFAGQLMKCALCNGTFTVPGLPGAAPPSAAPEPDVYGIQSEHSPQAPPPTPSFSLEPPASPPTPAPKSPPPPAAPPPEGYQRALTVWFSPRVLPWIAPVCLLLIFFLQFMDWVGIYPGGEPAVTGNAWRAAFGAYHQDNDLPQPAMRQEGVKPGPSLLTIFYLLLFFPALIVTTASVVLPMIQIKLPPQVEKLMPWRWGIVAAVNLILFLFLLLQVLLGFSLESHYLAWVDKKDTENKKENPTTQQQKEAKAERGQDEAKLRHTFWLHLTEFLHLVALVSAALMYWIAQRGTYRPEPKLELLW